MNFDPQEFLKQYAEAYNRRDPERMRACMALSDPRFAIFEDFSGELLDAETYGAMLESVVDSAGTMTFDLLRCDAFGDFAVVHAMQNLEIDDEEMGRGEASIRATLWVTLDGGAPRIVSAHFSEPPLADDECGCESGGGCGCGD